MVGSMVAGRAIGYVRVSVVGSRGDSFLSRQLQRESIERVCRRERLELVDVVEELDRSGGDASRPLWNACIERDAAALFALSAGAVRLWALSQDAVKGMSWPSVLSCALSRRDNLLSQWTNAGRALERERLDRWRREQDAARLRDEEPA
jgi:hypothetical protein